MSDNADNFWLDEYWTSGMRDHFGGVRFILYRCLPNLRVVRLEKNPETRLSRVQVFVVTSSVDCSCLEISLVACTAPVLHLDLPGHLAISPWRRLDLLRGSGGTQGGH